MSSALRTIVADSPQSTASRHTRYAVHGRGGNRRPELDAVPFRQRHIQAVIGPLSVLVRHGKSPVGNGGHIAQHKGQGHEIPNSLAGFLRREPLPPIRLQEGAYDFGLAVMRDGHVNGLALPIHEEYFRCRRVLLCQDFPLHDHTAIHPLPFHLVAPDALWQGMALPCTLHRMLFAVQRVLVRVWCTNV